MRIQLLSFLFMMTWTSSGAFADAQLPVPPDSQAGKLVAAICENQACRDQFKLYSFESREDLFRLSSLLCGTLRPENQTAETCYDRAQRYIEKELAETKEAIKLKALTAKCQTKAQSSKQAGYLENCLSSAFHNSKPYVSPSEERHDLEASQGVE